MYTFPHYKFRNKNRFIHALNVFLKPLMILIAGGKDSHWWDWEESPTVNTRVSQLSIKSTHPQKRTYKKTPLLGQYNLHGLKDLILTLLVLDEMAVLKPRDFKGEWSLVIRGNYGSQKYFRCTLIQKGKVRTLLDGKKHFLGVTNQGKYIPLTLVERCARNEHKNILFV